MVKRGVAMQLRGIHQRIKQIMQQKIDDDGLTFVQLHLLMLIKKYPDANQKDLAKEMKFTEGAMSGMVKRLIEFNLIEQVPLKLDMRYNRLILTDKGQAMIDTHEDDLLNVLNNLYLGLSENELVDLNKYLIRINKNLDDMNESNGKRNLEEKEV